MRFFKGVKISITVLTIILLSFDPAFSQDVEVIKDPDSLLSLARTAAFDDKNYDKAIIYIRRGLQLSPNYTDLVVFMGSLYTWKKETDSARYFFEKALTQKPEYENAYSSYSDMEFWNDRDSAALLILDRGLKYHPSSVNLLSRKARVLEELRSYKEAAYYADSALRLDNKNVEARAVTRRIQDFLSMNRVGIKYDYIYFNNQFPPHLADQPWQLISIDYTRQTKLGSIAARVNYAQRFGNSGLQYELESYPRISKTFYAYVNAGISNDSSVFPAFRFGASLFANLPSSFEAEAGVRYLQFTTGTDFYTIYLGKYFSNFLFGARTFIVPSKNSTSQSYFAIARYFLKGGVDDYLNLQAGYGLSPDDRPNVYQFSTPVKLKSYRAELTLRKSIKRLNIVTMNAGWVNQEYLPATTGNQFQFGLGYIRRF